MNEQQLNEILGTISEPVKNRFELSSRLKIAEINEEQKNKHKMLAIKNLATMKVVFSNN